MNYQYVNGIVFFMGHGQSDHLRNGFEDGFFKVGAPLQNGHTLVYPPRTWTTNVEHLANQLRRQGVCRVAMVSYSHGQAAATAFARYAHTIGLQIDLWIACDPVYRPTWLPRALIFQPLAFRALCKEGKIKVPENITRTVYVRQEKDFPRGHTLVPTSNHQVVECAGIYHTVGHTSMDDEPAFWDMVKTELDGWVNPKKAILINE